MVQGESRDIRERLISSQRRWDTEVHSEETASLLNPGPRGNWILQLDRRCSDRFLSETQRKPAWELDTEVNLGCEDAKPGTASDSPGTESNTSTCCKLVFMFVLLLLKEPTVIFSFIEMPQSRLAYLNTLRMFAERQYKRFVLSEYLWVQGWERVCFGDIFVSQRSVDRRTKCLLPPPKLNYY